jgi:hypothetical protein
MLDSGPPGTPRSPQGPPRPFGRPLPLAGILLGLAALFDVLGGIDLAARRYVTLTPEGVVQHDVAGWVWAQLVVGVLLAGAGLVAPLGRRWSTLAGLAAICPALLLHLLIWPYQPVQSLISVGLVLAAGRLLLRHGRPGRRPEALSGAGRPYR